MVAVTADKVIVELEARLGRYNANINASERNFNRRMNDMRRSGTHTEGVVRRSFGNMASSALALTVGLGGLTLAVREVAQLADKFTRFENRLKTAGIEGENLTRVGDRLFEVANRNGVEIEALGSVYARASLASKELGASQGQLDTFTRAVADALRVQGSSAEASRGALLQLSQALGQDVVRAEEFNSILEGALPIAQAAARGIDRFEGSVAKLRTAIINGEVTSKEFFEGILSDAPTLAAQAAKANLTLENSFTALYNQLARGIGQTDKSLGATEKLSDGILFLANNLGSLGEALTVITAALGSRLVASLTRAATEQAAYAAQVARGNVVTLGSARASEQQAAASLASARADEQAKASALAKARAVQQSAVVSTTDANAQFQRAAATKQLTALENQATAATARRIAAEQAHAAALGRTTVAARAAGVAFRAYAALSGLLGGPLGIALTALAGTYLIVSNRTAEAAERTEKLQAEMRQLGLLADDAADALDGTAESLENLADDQIRRKIRETIETIEGLKTSGPLQSIFGPLFDPESLRIDQVQEFAEAFRTNINPEIRAAGAEIEGLVKGIEDGTISADDLDKQLADIASRNLGSGVDSLLASLREIGPTILAAQPYLDRLERQLDGFTFAPRGGRRTENRAAGEAQRRETRGFLGERTRVASLDEETRAIERRAEAIQKEAEKAKIAITAEQALAQARKEIRIEANAEERERVTRLAQQDAETIADLQRAVETYGNERQQAVDRAVRGLSEVATPEQIARAREYAGTLFDLAEQERQRQVLSTEGRDAAIRGIEQEAAQLGVVGGALVELQFKQQRLNEIRAEGIPITRQIIEAVNAEAEAVRQVFERSEAANRPLRNQIEIADAVRQGFIDVGKAGVDGFDGLADAASRALDNIAQMILEMYVLKPLVESIFGATGTGFGGAAGGLFAGFFANGGRIPAGQFGIVGERGPEAVRATGGGIEVLPNSSLRPLSQTTNNGGSVTYNIDARGAEAGVEQRIMRALKQVNSSIESRAVRAVATTNSAGGQPSRAIRR